MLNKWIGCVLVIAVINFTACGNGGSQTGTIDTNVNIGTNPTTGEVDTGINGTNGNVPNTPDTNNNTITGSPNQNDTLNKKRKRQ
jgi:hypothetical protein